MSARARSAAACLALASLVLTGCVRGGVGGEDDAAGGAGTAPILEDGAANEPGRAGDEDS